MQTIKFEPDENMEHHECESFREGDWIVFRCPQCGDYERRMNWRTGEMRSRNARPEFYHTGSHVPPVYREAFEFCN